MNVDKNIINDVLNGEASQHQATEIANYFCSKEGENEFSSRLHDKFYNNIKEENIDTKKIEIIKSRILNEVKSSKKTTSPWLVAAALVPLFTLGNLALLLNFQDTDPAVHELITSNGNKVTITLEDKSTIILNSGSKLIYPAQFSDNERRVKLEGQAYFNIAHNKEKPFIVDLGETNIQVTGTKFDVEAYGSSPLTQVTLDEGGIIFNTPHASYKLEPHNQLEYNQEKDLTKIIHVQNNQASEWRYNRLSFDKTNLKDVLLDIERMYGVNFEVLDSRLYNYSYSMQCDQLEVDKILKRMERITPIRFTKNKHEYTVSFAQ